MRLATFDSGRGPRASVVAADGTVVPASELVPGAPDDMVALIAAGDELHGRLRAAAQRARGGTALRAGRLLAPIPRPARDVFCVGWNYSEHFQEGAQFRAAQGAPGQQEIPEFPALFSKNPATVTGPDSPIWFPAPHSDQLDWEVELAVIIGRGGRDIGEADAMSHVFGYTCGNDVSVRDVQRRHGGQWFKGKNFDSHMPLGPWIVTADSLDPSALAVRTRVNGVTKQDSNTRFMVFKIPRLIREFSAGCELVPGDILITGTPEGVGFARKPPEFMKIGDVVEVEIEGIGVLRNTVQGRSSSWERT
ncbi:MAG TPA: fumarylacetoacetate hydrolase family protein [Candidatus Limnocylindria bacterium]|nr:fumarylacetoacetate hydrolase family protein [Candidatus Limnocylindria bacterium]